MKITNVKAMVAKMFTVGLLAGAVVMAAPTKADAQVALGVRIGPARVFVGPGYVPAYRAPVYVAPAPYYGYYRPEFYRHDWDRRDFYRHDHDFDRHFDRR